MSVKFNEPRGKIYNNILETIGGTPLVRLNSVIDHPKIKENNVQVLIKLESFNPMSSVKDRVAYNIIYKAYLDGRLKEGMTLIEATSGNTGIGICEVASVLGFKVVIVMPENMSQERQMIMKAFGAELILTPKANGMPGAIATAKKMIEENPDKYFEVKQFENLDNPDAHKYTADEIFKDTDGKVDIFISAVGTGGTVIGTGRELKKLKKDVKVVAVEPAESSVLQGKPKGPHGIQGIGAGFVPVIFDREVVDQYVSIETKQAWTMSRALVKYEGIMVGMSTGAATLAAMREAMKPENKGKTIVAIAPSSGERYLSTDLYKIEIEQDKQKLLESLY